MGVELVGVELVDVGLLVGDVLAVAKVEGDAVVGDCVLEEDGEMVVERDFVDTRKLE